MKILCVVDRLTASHSLGSEAVYAEIHVIKLVRARSAGLLNPTIKQWVGLILDVNTFDGHALGQPLGADEEVALSPVPRVAERCTLVLQHKVIGRHVGFLQVGWGLR